MMKKTIVTFFALMLTLSVGAQALFVGTYNIRNSHNNDAKNGNGWDIRYPKICAQVNFLQPDIFGVQEAYVEQMQDMKGALDGYDYIGVGRDDGKEQGEYAGIFFKADKISMLDKGNFWLNETPDVPKLGWDAACVRICSWGKFLNNETQMEFFYFNLHMDHVGVVARREGAKLVVQKIREIAQGAPVILTGDFNVDQTDEIYTIFTQSGILNDSYEVARQRFAENGTFNSYNTDLKTQSRIDHVFVSPSFTVNNYAVFTDCYWVPNEQTEQSTQKGNDAPQQIDFKTYTRRTFSDHYPVMVKLSK